MRVFVRSHLLLASASVLDAASYNSLPGKWECLKALKSLSLMIYRIVVGASSCHTVCSSPFHRVGPRGPTSSFLPLFSFSKSTAYRSGEFIKK
jgi:hypothetical protein